MLFKSVFVGVLAVAGLASWVPAASSVVQARTEPQQTAPHQLVGTVANRSGEPLAGATVMLAANRNSSVITNSAGRFLLPSPQPTPELRVSFAGYYDTTVVMPPAGQPLVVELRAVARYKKQLKKQLKSADKAWRKN
ncbi:carboxypeptidase-like regulatory domain-containing protein [Hymenobacter canadensis]|uniref:Carboxypeptidase-like regulatory domain-containing protein n=1 Tax=Hymenobacter canadensis TaxID=2999067 RepID=A0ABY7LQC5_9BACT|nr:carboxypeptidase-like regulatory domain-containing protein [Hymenobacter canadensis]WBA42620.1 carboxypeptidase-like regulatory domain-containing protein [Hymenobacter canadensis]